jgi:dethiobiotin synthetase
VKSYFITGTDTGVGKTTITAAMAACIKKLGIDVGVMKPVATGIPQKSGFKSDDVSILCKSCGVDDTEDLVNPVFMPMPASPYDVSKILGLEFDRKVIFEKFEKLKSKHEMLLVEGIGGMMTPLSQDYFVADLIKDMGLEAIIVTRSALGTLNHTMMTVKTCHDYKIPIKGIIVNNYDGKKDLVEKNSPLTIHEITNIPILGIVPLVRNYKNIEMIIPHIEKNIDLKSLIS